MIEVVGSEEDGVPSRVGSEESGVRMASDGGPRGGVGGLIDAEWCLVIGVVGTGMG